MKSILVVVTVGLSTLYAGSGHSHSHEEHGHSHGHHEHANLDNKLISSKEVQETAQKELERLASENKIPSSWKSMAVSKIGKDSNGYSSDWVVVFKNEKIKKQSKQTLYIFVGLHGDVTGANYTGK